jgi:hypothetical protein
MKQRLLAILITIISIIVLSTIGYIILHAPFSKEEQSLKSIENAAEIYETAVSGINPSNDMILRISATNEMTIGESTFLEISDKTIQYDVQKTGEHRIQVQETLTTGNQKIYITEIQSGEMIYLTVNDTPFVGNCNTLEYTESLTPAVILSAELYESIRGIDTGSGYRIDFSAPIAHENWLTSDHITLLNARGTATVNYDGTLNKSSYTVSYQQSDIIFRATVHVIIEQQDVTVAVPDDNSEYTVINHWSAPKLLERACGFLVQADSISSDYTDRIYFQAIGDERTQSIKLHAFNDGQWSMCMNTDICLKNDTKQDQKNTHSKREQFINNQYSASSDSQPPAFNAGITVDTVNNYFQNQLVSTLILPKDILTAEVSEVDGMLCITFSGTDAFGDYLAENACQILYQNPKLISDTGAEIQTKNLQCYLSIDKQTGLPVASGVSYTGGYKAEGLPYLLEYSAEQLYTIPSDTAKNEIQKAAGE